MEKEIVELPVSESQFIELVKAAKNKDPDATIQLIELFHPDIKHLSRFIYNSPEDVASEIIVEFLEFIHTDDRI